MVRRGINSDIMMKMHTIVVMVVNGVGMVKGVVVGHVGSVDRGWGERCWH